MLLAGRESTARQHDRGREACSEADCCLVRGARCLRTYQSLRLGDRSDCAQVICSEKAGIKCLQGEAHPSAAKPSVAECCTRTDASNSQKGSSTGRTLLPGCSSSLAGDSHRWPCQSRNDFFACARRSAAFARTASGHCSLNQSLVLCNLDDSLPRRMTQLCRAFHLPAQRRPETPRAAGGWTPV